MNVFFSRSIFCLLLSSFGILAACNRASQEVESVVWKLGHVGSLTGSEATFGISTKNGMELALREVNEAGGVHGKKLALVHLDDQGKAEEAATSMLRLIDQERVIAVLGEVASSRSLAMAPIAQGKKIPMISPSSTNPKVTEQGDYIFRVCFIDPFQGDAMARFARTTLKLDRVAILRDIKSDYSMGLSKFFRAAFEKAGGVITGEESYGSGDTDFKAQLTSLKGANPEAFFIPGYYTEVGLIARQAREIGSTAVFLGGDGWDSPSLLEIGGKSLEGAYFSTHYSAENENPVVQDFIRTYKERFGEVPDAMAASGYDALKVVADALQRSGPEVTSEKLRDALANTKDFVGVTGSITIDEHRNARKPAVVLHIKEGRFAYSTTVDP